jgi:hypothetical protein
VAPVPAWQPGFREPGDDAGTPASRHARLISRLLAVLLGLAAVRLAHEAGVVGKAAIPPLTRAGIASVGLFAVTGWGLTRLLLPEGLRRYEPLWVMPVGACATAVAMTVLGFAAVPYRLNLAMVLIGGAGLALYAYRTKPVRLPAGTIRRMAWPAWIALLLVAIALIPLFRAGFATVEGQGQDAHLAVGSAIFLQRHYPTSIAPQEPVDRMPLVWRSKQPIYYTLAAASSLSGLEVFETISALAAILLALAASGFYLVAREVLGAPRWAALGAMGLVGLDRMVLHTVMHPYFNQTWGFFAMPFAFVLAWWAIHERTRGGLILLGLFLGIVAFAYPLALPVPLIPLAVVMWPERGRLHPRRWWKGKRSLRWVVPLGLVMFVPLRGVVEKILSADDVVLNPFHTLRNWGGDLNGYFPEPNFFGMDTYLGLAVMALPMAYAITLALRGLDRPMRRGLTALLLFTAFFVLVFRIREAGWYFHFKLLAFVAPLVLTIVAAGAARIRPRWAGAGLLVVLVMLASSAANTEVGRTFDELPRSMLALRSIHLPKGESIRLDISTQQQNWAAFMLHHQPLCSQHPLLGTSYPHVAISRRADYILTAVGERRPADALGGPVKRLDGFTLYKARPGLPGPDRCSQTMVQTVKSISTRGS